MCQEFCPLGGGMHGKRGSCGERRHAWQKGVHGERRPCMAKGRHVHDEGGVHGNGQVWQKGVCMVGGMHSSGHAWWGACMAGKTATAVDSTHPTGMHSCQ